MSLFAQRRAALPMLGWLAAAATPLCAQQQGQGLQSPAPQQANAAAESLQQSAFARPNFYVEARLSLEETAYTRSGSSSASSSDAITSVTPSLYVSSRAGRLQGLLDYALIGVTHARGNESSRLLNKLRSNASAELVERHVYLDAEASISQQAINPLGVDTADDLANRTNRSEVRTVQLTPRAQGRLGDVAQWDARVAHRITHSAAVNTTDSSSTQWQLQIGNLAQQRLALGWGAQLSHSVQSFSQGRGNVSDIARGTLDWRINPDFSTGVIAGYESTDIATDDKQGRATYGLRLRWVPSERTNVLAEAEKRFFGDAHNVVVSHRMARSVVSFSDARTLSFGLGQSLAVARGSVYEFFDQLYAFSETDASAREAKVLQSLNKYGYSASQPSKLLPAFLSSSVTLQRSQQISYSWLGMRDVFTFAVEQTSGRLVRNTQVFGDPFTANTNIRQRGFDMSLAHRLTQLSSVKLGFTQRSSLGDTNSTRLRSMTAQYTTSLGPRTGFSLSARRSNFKSSTQPYTETALTGSVSMTF